MKLLMDAPWPGNVRELEKTLRSAAVLSRGETIEPEHLPELLQAPKEAAPLDAEDVKRRDELVALLQQHGGNVTQVAKAMGKARQQVQRWLRRYDLDPLSYRR
jgi:transcriptional regulator of acetoin/glycerol metabolism